MSSSAGSEASARLGSAGLDADTTWAAGEPGQVIAETARRIGADVIVLGEHHHGRLASFSARTSTTRYSSMPGAK